MHIIMGVRKLIVKSTEDRVRSGPGRSLNFIMAFFRTGKSWKKATGPGKFWKSVKLSYKI